MMWQTMTRWAAFGQEWQAKRMSACHIQGMEGNQTPGYCGQAGLMLPVHAWAMETGSWLEKKVS